MNKTNDTKKQPLEDWHKADIKAALEKAGWTLARLAFHHGYKSRSTLTIPLHLKWPKGERLIAEAIGLHPSVIWPSRYQKSTKASRSRNVKAQGAV